MNKWILIALGALAFILLGVTIFLATRPRTMCPVGPTGDNGGGGGSTGDNGGSTGDNGGSTGDDGGSTGDDGGGGATGAFPRVVAPNLYHEGDAVKYRYRGRLMGCDNSYQGDVPVMNAYGIITRVNGPNADVLWVILGSDDTSKYKCRMHRGIRVDDPLIHRSICRWMGSPLGTNPKDPEPSWSPNLDTRNISLSLLQRYSDRDTRINDRYRIGSLVYYRFIYAKYDPNTLDPNNQYCIPGSNEKQYAIGAITSIEPNNSVGIQWFAITYSATRGYSAPRAEYCVWAEGANAQWNNTWLWNHPDLPTTLPINQLADIDPRTLPTAECDN